MNSLHSERDPFEELAEAFLARYRAGERPSVSEFAQQHPELAEKICDLLPALVMMEELRPHKGGPTALGSGKVSDDGKIPQQLGEYHIVREVGRGGMGVVYEAVQESLGRHVALKVLPFNSLISPTHLERFRREARAAARLHHTNIVPVFSVGEHEGIHYYAMQFIQGQGLDLVLREVKRLRSRKEKGMMPEPQSGQALASNVAEGLLSGAFSCPPPDSAAAGLLVPKGDFEGPGANATNLRSVPLLARPAASAPEDRSAEASKQWHTTGQSELTGSSETQYFRSVARVGVQVAEALEYAHRQGVLHRDIKPSNLLLDTAGTVWVTDFGLAKEHDSEELTSPGDVVGTLRYMAPERFEGRSDPRSDVYGLGMTLYELLTLRPALDNSHRARLIERIKQENPPLPSKIDRRIPRDLETIVLKAIAKEPGQRYATAEALAEDLRRALADRPIRARRTPLLERAWRLCRRNPALSVLTVSVALLLVILAIGSTTAALWLNRSARQQTDKLCQALLAQARNGRLSRRVGQRFESLRAVEEAVRLARELKLPEDRFLELRNEAIACMALPDLRVAREWEGAPAGTVLTSFDGMLERYARMDRHGTVSIRRVADDREIHRFTEREGAAWLKLSSDGQFVMLSSGPLQKLWKLAGPEPSLFLELRDCNAYAFSPDCRQVAFARRNGFVDFYDLASGERIRQLQVGAEPGALAFHPTGRQLAIAFTADVQVRDDAGKKLVEFPVAECSCLAWHPDGKVLAAVSEGNIIYLWDVVNRKQTARLEGCRSAGLRIAFNHAGNLLASTGWEGMLRLWDPRTGRQLFHTPAKMWDIHFSPDDCFLATEAIGTKLRIWEVDAGREYRTPARIPPRRETGTRSTVSPDGRLLAVGTINAGFGLWDLASGKELLFHPMPGITQVVFEPSGALLAQGWNRLWRWPVQIDGATVQLGPPQPISLPGSVCRVACSGDGWVIASPQLWGALILNANHPERPVILAPHSDVRCTDVSPDGRWVATSSHGASWEVKVWESESGKLAKALFVGEFGLARFSPDGQWLAARGDDVCVWEVGSWRSRWQLGAKAVGDVAFSPDSKMLAFGTRDGVVRLVNAENGREWARLSDPDQDRPDGITFTPDGTQLLIMTGDGAAVHAWDLRAIRARLAEMGLDWDLPPYPEEQSSSSKIPVREVKLDLGNNLELYPGDDDVLVGLNSFLLALNPFDWEAYWRRGRLYGLRSEPAKSIADYTMALSLLPAQDTRRAEILFRRANNYLRLQNHARALADLEQVVKLDLGEFCGLHAELARVCNDMARRLVAGPEKERNPSRALPLTEKAVALTPELSLYRGTLALVYYRLGKYRQAIELLERAQSSDAFDLFILAMSYAHLGEGARALEYYHQAVTWLHEHQGRLPAAQRTELEALKAETEAVLAPLAKF